MVRTLITAAVLAAASLPAIAGELKIKVDESPVPQGSFAVLTLPDVAGTAEVTWTFCPAPTKHKPFPGGCVVAAQPGTTVTVNVQAIDFKNSRNDSGTVSLPFGGATPDPVVPPGPGPGPTPPPQPDPLGLRAAVREGLAKVTANAQQKAAGTKELAAMNRSHASAIAAGGAGLDSGGQFSAKTAVEEWGYLNGDVAEKYGGIAAWEPMGGPVLRKLSELATSGKIRTKAEYVTAFQEIANGFQPAASARPKAATGK